MTFWDIWANPLFKSKDTQQCLVMSNHIKREVRLRVDYEQQSERNVSARENHPTREKATRGSRGVIFTRARVSLALLMISEEKWGTTRSLTPC